MKNRRLVIVGVGIAVIIAVYLLYPRQQAIGEFDLFAQCLAENGVTMYGADWCSHCQNEKKAFGDSFRFVPYVECPDDPQKCLANGINSYPTWIFSDEKKLEGEQGLEKLSRESGCILPNNKK